MPWWMTAMAFAVPGVPAAVFAAPCTGLRLVWKNLLNASFFETTRRAGCRLAVPLAKPRIRDPKRSGCRPGPRTARRRAPGRVDEYCDVPLPPGLPQVRRGSAGDGHGHAGAGRTAGSARDRAQVLGGGRRLPGMRAPDAGPASASEFQRRRGRRGAARPAVGGFGGHPQQAVGLSFGKAETLLRQQYGVAISRSGLVRAVARAGRRAKPTHEDLLKQLGKSSVVTPDETAWRVGGPAWLWAGGDAADDRLPDPARTRLSAGRQAARRGLRRRDRPRRLGREGRGPSAQLRRHRDPVRVEADPPPARRGPLHLPVLHVAQAQNNASSRLDRLGVLAVPTIVRSVVSSNRRFRWRGSTDRG